MCFLKMNDMFPVLFCVTLLFSWWTLLKKMSAVIYKWHLFFSKSLMNSHESLTVNDRWTFIEMIFPVALQVVWIVEIIFFHFESSNLESPRGFTIEYSQGFRLSVASCSTLEKKTERWKLWKTRKIINNYRDVQLIHSCLSIWSWIELV